MDQEEEMRRLRKAVADAYGEDRAWMTATGRAEELIREARTHQKLILANSRLGVEVRRGAIDAAIKEIEGLCLLAEELLRKAARE